MYRNFPCKIPTEGFSKVEKFTLYDESLSKIYSMNYNSTGRLLAAGGHGGHVSVYGLDIKDSDSKVTKLES